jgi:glutamate formiminotransferase
MLECVPNFSEGRDVIVVEAIVNAIASVPGVLLAGWEMDTDHNRSVVTFAGPANAVVNGAVRGVDKAAQLIDIGTHQGVHPRVGAADVIPFVPLDGSSMDEAVEAARKAGEQIWRRSRIPVYFYGEANRREDRLRLEVIRRSGFDGAPPDVGDVTAHPTAGAAMVGARGFLVAYNVRLATTDVQIAKQIARAIRESSGGFLHVKALGLYLASRQCAQVSMNLTNFAETPLELVYDAIAAAAAERGTRIAACELIGFVPRRAFDMAPEFFRRAENFTESRILETRLAQLVR